MKRPNHHIQRDTRFGPAGLVRVEHLAAVVQGQTVSTGVVHGQHGGGGFMQQVWGDWQATTQGDPVGAAVAVAQWALGWLLALPAVTQVQINSGPEIAVEDDRVESRGLSNWQPYLERRLAWFSETGQLWE